VVSWWRRADSRNCFSVCSLWTVSWQDARASAVVGEEGEEDRESELVSWGVVRGEL
jgi:hypothetical protein